MAVDQKYNREAMDLHLEQINSALTRIETQTIRTNGRVSKLERNLIVIVCVVGTMLIMSGSRFIDLIKTFI